MSLPRLVVAAPSSGAGKTTVATGLMAALRARGLVVSPHKVGPDYIDPGYHALATGRPGRNLDPVLVGVPRIAPLLLHGAAGADVAVIEGVMGLYDGKGSTSFGSTAHVATLVGAPVVLVVDASSQSRSVAALVQGFDSFDPAVRVAGVVLNRVASDRHEQVLREALAPRFRVLGAIRRDASVEAPSRHLGLVPVAERAAEAVATVERLGQLVAASCDLDAILEIARTAGDLGAAPWAPSRAETTARPVVAVAGGPAFTFAYSELSECLVAAGAEVAVFDPLRDEALPAGTGAVVLPGGFPEVFAHQLSANTPLLANLRSSVGAGLPTYAECAGLLVLCATLDGHAMAGQVPASARMTERLTLGYREAVAPQDTLVAPVGTRVHGHEFHRTTVEPRAGSRAAWLLDGEPEGFATDSTVASYLHLHPAGVPSLATGLVAAAARQVVAA
ncbi:MAG TPA: cobyrinate a,c-diamide synthase [Mycobacteriales bacterium]|nr:cobyrinate a,c-diamide synthase [Mycobacteriales bacterium]